LLETLQPVGQEETSVNLGRTGETPRYCFLFFFAALSRTQYWTIQPSYELNGMSGLWWRLPLHTFIILYIIGTGWA